MSHSAPDLPNFHAQRIGKAIALSDGDVGTEYTWAALDDRVGRIATVLSRGFGVSRGDRVCLLTENDPRVLEVQFACMRLGAIFVPLNWRLAATELHAIVEDAQPVLVVHDRAWSPVAREVADKAGVPVLSWDDDAAPNSDYSDYENLLADADWLPPQDHAFDELTHILYTSRQPGCPRAHCQRMAPSSGRRQTSR
jgi:fatty-acyl-CoA synthase